MVVFAVPPEQRHDMAAHFAVARRVAADISAHFPPPVELEFEKCYFPYLLFAKKRYCGGMYTSPGAMDGVDVKGIAFVRRDNCPLVKTASQAVLDAIMVHKSPELAVAEARRVVLGVLRGEYAMDQFVVSKRLASSYKQPNHPHVAVARKRQERTGAAPPVGERIPYVFVRDDDHPKGLQAEIAEDPAYAAEHGLPLDVLYYVETQLRAPLVGLLEMLEPDVDAIVFGSGEIGALLGGLRARRTAVTAVVKRKRKNAAASQAEITKFFAPRSGAVQ